ncbi:MAG TPA: hypothetical protein VGK16_13570 [Candidatus Limnocylindrales bacterium]|jgi:hypothetical protein
MDNVSNSLSDWRASERRRDAFAQGSPEWIRADADVRQARAAYQASVARVEAAQSEPERAEHREWWQADLAVERGVLQPA